jgi:hypothetical protein
MGVRLSPLRAALVAVAVLAGLFAMHGLTHHGEHLPAGAATHADAHPVVPSGTVPVLSSGDHASLAPVAPDSHPAMALCLTVLLTGMLAAAAVRRPRTGVLLLAPGRLARFDPPRPVWRAHDPPLPRSLSVCRC